MSSGKTILGIVLVIIGLSWLFHLPLFSFILPILVIWLGVKLILGKPTKPSWEQTEESAPAGPINRTMIFSGINKKYTSDDFTGGEFTCVFGGGEIDLSKVATKQKQIVIDVTAVIGGLKLTIPEKWSVTTEGMGIIGGFDNHVVPPKTAKDTKVNLIIKGVAVLGGVEVCNNTSPDNLSSRANRV